VLDAAKDTFDTVFVEKDDELEFVARYDISYYPTLVWTDATGEELMRTVQSQDPEEVLSDQALALELLNEDPDAEDGDSEDGDAEDGDAEEPDAE
jgi:hypothetical protein